MIIYDLGLAASGTLQLMTGLPLRASRLRMLGDRFLTLVGDTRVARMLRNDCAMLQLNLEAYRFPALV